jgi:hypothetical protein
VAWPAFAEHIRTLYDFRGVVPDGATSGDGFREHRFDITINPSGVPPLRLRGSIDAVESLGPLTLVTDYKRRGTARRGDVVTGLEPQLLCYAAALSEGALGEPIPLSNMATGYWSILGGTWAPGVSGTAVQPTVKALGLEGARMKGDVETSVGRMLAHWKFRHDLHISGKGALAPEPGDRCVTCRLQGVCRKDDPALEIEPTAPTAFKTYFEAFKKQVGKSGLGEEE